MTRHRLKFPLALPTILLLVILVIQSAGFQKVQAAQVQTPPTPSNPIRDFELLTPSSGWLLQGQQLFSTQDGGNNWVPIPPPSAAVIWAVDFLDPTSGWVVSTLPASSDQAILGFQLSVTPDGGQTWKTTPLDLDPFPGMPGLQPENITVQYNNALSGQLFFKRPTSSNFNLYTGYQTQDGGQTWQLLPGDPSPSSPLPPPGLIPPSLPGQVTRLSFPPSPDSQPGSSTFNLQPSTLWALFETGTCTGHQNCTQTQSLLRTFDGGGTWQTLTLPASTASPAPANPELQVSGQGFDKCEIPTLTSLQEWWNQGPYTAVNLYFGGIMRACANKALTPPFLSDVDRQGWTLIPTWVGPQASCSGFKYVMSPDPTTAYQQGIDEANLAASAAIALKLWGQALYYDLESFPSSDLGCLEAAKAFMNGWTFRLHEWGFVSGVYGSPCTSGLSSFWSLPNLPEAVWIAHWLSPAAYNPAATVWTSVCGFSDSYWPNHQRLRQYAGGHAETWGSVTLSIDSNAVDGYVAKAFGQPPQACPRPADPAKAGVILYTAANYDCYGRQAGFGYLWRNRSGFQNLSSFFDERASSIYIPTGWSALLFENRDQGGGKICINAPGDANFAGKTFDNGHKLDSLVSSFTVFAGKNCAEPSPVNPAADTQPPSVDITSHVNGGFINPATGSVVIQATLSDAGSGISHAQFFAGADTGSGWSWQPVGYDNDGSNGWNASWSPGSLASLVDIGLYVLAWDQAGNVAGTPVLHLSMSDSQPPVSAVDPLPASLESTAVPVSWGAADAISGIGHYDLQVQDNGGAWVDWLVNVPGSQTSGVFYGQFGHTYGFRSRAADLAGNLSVYPASAETTTKVNTCTGDSFEVNNTLAAAKLLNLNAPQAHTICGLGDQDWLSFKVSAGQAYQFSTSNLGAQTDTVLGLYTANGALIAQNDNTGSNLSSRLVYLSPSAATVYLKIAHQDGRIAGAAITYSVNAAQASLYWLPVIIDKP